LTYQVECKRTDGEADDDRFKPLEIVILKSLENGIEIEIAFVLVLVVLIVEVDCQEGVMTPEFFFNGFQACFLRFPVGGKGIG